MKKILLFASAALLFVGCAKENITPTENPDNSQKGDITLSFSASQTGFGTKAVIGETIDTEGAKSTAINWQSTDQISVFDGKNKNCPFSTKDFSAEATSCTFEGTVTAVATDYTAMYPYTEGATISETGVISGVTLPATQIAVADSFDPSAALMAAKTVSGGRALAFQNLVGYVKVATDFDCKKIELCAASGEALAGAGSITFDAEGNPSFAIATEGAASSITLQGTITAGKTYYIAVPAQTLAAGWSLSFTATDENVYKREAAKQIVFKKNTVINLGTVKLDDLIPYVTFSAESEQTFTMNFQPWSKVFTLGDNEYFEYRVGYGKWQDFKTTVSGIKFGGSLGDLQLRGISSQGTGTIDKQGNLSCSTISFGEVAKVACSGDIRTLVDYENYETASTSNARFCNLFYGCSQLTSSPDLPATTLADHCYSNMFEGCSSLTSAPELPAKTLATGCYCFMFCGCSSLKTAPKLPATTLAEDCYLTMFGGCSKLASSIELPAETLYERCYHFMFNGCNSLNQIIIRATDIRIKHPEKDEYITLKINDPTINSVLNETFLNWIPTNYDGIIYGTDEFLSLCNSCQEIPSGWTVWRLSDLHM